MRCVKLFSVFKLWQFVKMWSIMNKKLSFLRLRYQSNRFWIFYIIRNMSGVKFTSIWSALFIFFLALIMYLCMCGGEPNELWMYSPSCSKLQTSTGGVRNCSNECILHVVPGSVRLYVLKRVLSLFPAGLFYAIIFLAGLFPADFSPLGLFPVGLFPARSFSR